MFLFLKFLELFLFIAIGIFSFILINQEVKKDYYNKKKNIDKQGLVLGSVSFFIVIYSFGFNLQSYLTGLVFLILSHLVFVDFYYKEIPDSSNLAILIIGLTLSVINLSHMKNMLLTGVFVFLFYLIVSVLSKGGLGGGDIKLSGVLGVLLGLYIDQYFFLIGLKFILFSCMIGIFYYTFFPQDNKQFPFAPAIFFAFTTLMLNTIFAFIIVLIYTLLILKFEKQ